MNNKKKLLIIRIACLIGSLIIAVSTLLLSFEPYIHTKISLLISLVLLFLFLFGDDK